MNVNMFTQQIEVMHRRLDELYRDANTSVQLQPQLLPVAFKELGVVSEELQVAVEELQQQNEELATARVEVEIQRQRYQDLFELSPDGYLVTDINGTIQEANCAAANLLNVSQRFLVGKPLIIFVTEDERQVFHAKLLELQQSEQVEEWLVCLVPRKSEPFNAALTLANISDAKGNVVGMRICVRDISDVERELRSPTQAEAGRKR
jgi:PAS domain S-box-containing protein